MRCGIRKLKTKCSDETFNFSFESIPSCSYTFYTEIQMKRKTQWYLLYKILVRVDFPHALDTWSFEPDKSSDWKNKCRARVSHQDPTVLPLPSVTLLRIKYCPNIITTT